MAMGNKDLPQNGSVDVSTKQQDIRHPEESQIPDSTSSNTVESADSKATHLRTKIPSTSITSSSTLYEPSERSISATTIYEGIVSEPIESSPAFRSGHGVCCDADLIKRCLDHDSDEDIIPTKQQLPSADPVACVHVAVDPKKYPYSYHGWVTTLSRKERKRMAAKARAALNK
jgi:hypothetical protein